MLYVLLRNSATRKTGLRSIQQGLVKGLQRFTSRRAYIRLSKRRAKPQHVLTFTFDVKDSDPSVETPLVSFVKSLPRRAIKDIDAWLLTATTVNMVILGHPNVTYAPQSVFFRQYRLTVEFPLYFDGAGSSGTRKNRKVLRLGPADKKQKPVLGD